MPNAAAATEPTTMPIIGAHRRQTGDPRRVSAPTTMRVTSAVNGAATGSASAASSSRPKTADARVMERIIITVPLIVGVTIRRRKNSHLEITNWKAADARISVVSVAGPPSTSAVIQNGIEKAAVNSGSTAPAPTGPSRRTCSNVATPTTTSVAKTIHPK